MSRLGRSRRACTVALGVWLTGHLPASAAATHADEIHTYATMAAIGAVVARRCPDLRVRADGLSQLGAALHLTPADDMAVELEIRVYTKIYSSQVDSDPAGWCGDVLERFGPDGSLMREFLGR